MCIVDGQNWHLVTVNTCLVFVSHHMFLGKFLKSKDKHDSCFGRSFVLLLSRLSSSVPVVRTHSLCCNCVIKIKHRSQVRILGTLYSLVVLPPSYTSLCYLIALCTCFIILPIQYSITPLHYLVLVYCKH